MLVASKIANIRPESVPGLGKRLGNESMALQRNRLTHRAVQTLKEPGRHADGGNLYLNITKSEAKSWVYMYNRAGRQREIGLGSCRDVSLAKARDLAEVARQELRDGREPLGARTKTSGKPTFGEAADTYIAVMRPSWRNEKHVDQWIMTLGVYAAPLRSKPVDEIDTMKILAVLQPIWTE